MCTSNIYNKIRVILTIVGIIIQVHIFKTTVTKIQGIVSYRTMRLFKRHNLLRRNVSYNNISNIRWRTDSTKNKLFCVPCDRSQEDLLENESF